MRASTTDLKDQFIFARPRPDSLTKLPLLGGLSRSLNWDFIVPYRIVTVKSIFHELKSFFAKRRKKALEALNFKKNRQK